MAKAKATDPTTEIVVASYTAVEPLRINGVDIAPGENFTSTEEVAKPLLAHGAAIAAE